MFFERFILLFIYLIINISYEKLQISILNENDKKSKMRIFIIFPLLNARKMQVLLPSFHCETNRLPLQNNNKPYHLQGADT